MRNRPLCFVLRIPGSTPVSGVGFGVSLKQSFRKSAIARRVRSPIRLAISFMLAPLVCIAQDVARSTSTTADGDEVPQAESVVVSATRFDIPLDQSPASVSVINSAEIEQKQIERVSDALREVPGLSVV